ncbi:uncharacterized protein BKA78DRAFT_311390, partial [Phyllosticta capitalensis]|uniref:uncharacterized protein n=1 Tax=Phyllosticta capitalensis TaxID=121624 RepID=UPI00312E03E1
MHLTNTHSAELPPFVPRRPHSSRQHLQSQLAGTSRISDPRSKPVSPVDPHAALTKPHTEPLLWPHTPNSDRPATLRPDKQPHAMLACTPRGPPTDLPDSIPAQPATSTPLRL